MKAIFKKVLAAARSPFVWAPLALLAAATCVFRCTDLDIAWVRPFYAPDASNPPWPMKHVQPWKGIYDWGEYPALAIGCASFLIWLVSFVWKRIRTWRDPAFFLALLLAIGPGLLVNVLLKPNWARPRPNAVSMFGGPREFLPVWQMGQGRDDWSFPSGHAAAGFYLMGPAFICYRRRPWLAAAFLLLGLTCGAAMGLARVVAGGHFPSDILWAGGLIYFTALILAIPFRFGLEKPIWCRDPRKINRAPTASA